MIIQHVFNVLIRFPILWPSNESPPLSLCGVKTSPTPGTGEPMVAAKNMKGLLQSQCLSLLQLKPHPTFTSVYCNNLLVLWPCYLSVPKSEVRPKKKRNQDFQLLMRSPVLTFQLKRNQIKCFFVLNTAHWVSRYITNARLTLWMTE